MRIMISCGEASGDLYAGALAAALRARAPDVEIVGFGGRRLQQAGASLVGEFTGLTVTGLTEAVRVLPRSFAMYRRLVAAARGRRPDVFVAIDFPDFNFRLMAALRRLGVPVVYYVSPQLWAWRPGRMATMKRFVQRVLVIFPFEAPLYERVSIPVQFVGHPLVDLARARQARDVFLRDRGLRPDAPTVALLPGSRPNELRRLAPVMAAALPLVRARVPDAQFVVARAPYLPDVLFVPFVGRALSGSPGAPDTGVPAAPARWGGVARPTIVVDEATDDVLAASDVVITASGTATVQAALHERPMVVVYQVSPLTYRLGKPFLKVDTYAMPNLVAGRRIVPELIQDACTPERIAAEAVALLTDPDRHTRARAALGEVRERLGGPGASGRAADAILEVAVRAPGGATPA
ncbi:MAG: lipid-A-disaccharide synthase [Acidobacteria bacterium]|nr:lipid-A-disaccharide synthase [Acidobacteriota bacterium]